MKYPLLFSLLLLQSLSRAQTIAERQVDSLIQLNRTLTTGRNYQEALDAADAAINLAATALGTDHLSYAYAIFNKGRTYQIKGEWTNAEREYLASLKLYRMNGGPANADQAKVLNNLGALYNNMMRYEDALAAHREAMEIRAVNPGKLQPEYAYSLNNYSNVYLNMNAYEYCIPLYQEALSIMEMSGKQEDVEYATILTGIGVAYNHLGLHRDAISYFKRANVIREKKLPKDDPLYTQGYNNLATTYSTIALYDSAGYYFSKINDIMRSTNRVNLANYAVYLHNLGLMYYKMNDTAASEKTYLEAMQLWRDSLDQNSSDYAATMEGLAKLYLKMNKVKESLSLFRQAYGLRERLLSKTGPEIIFNQMGTAMAYWANGMEIEASAEFIQAQQLQKELMLRSTAGVPERRIISLTEELKLNTDYIFSFALRHARTTQYNLTPNVLNKIGALSTNRNADAALNKMLWEHLNTQRDAALETRILLEKSISSVSDTHLLQTYKEWQTLKRQIAAEYGKTLAEQKGLAKLEPRAERLEAELRLALPDFAALRRKANWQDVRDNLDPDEVLVEFVSFNRYDPQPTPEVSYAALISRKDRESPDLVYLCSNEDLEKIIQKGVPKGTLISIRAYLTNLYSQPKLYTLLWKPVEPFLKGIKRVYYSPYGELHNINLAALHAADNQPFSTRYELHRLGSGRRFVAEKTMKQEAVDHQSAILYGGIEYRPDSLALAQFTAGYEKSSQAPPLPSVEAAEPGTGRNRDFQSVLSYLPGTLSEVQSINTMLDEQHFQTMLLSNFSANEAHIKQIGKTIPIPKILHIATHGFFFSKNDGATPFEWKNHPMMRSGLAFAGANQMLQYHHAFAGMEDGILTANEASQLDLKGTELVVLSACESGLGEFVGKEGLFGLERAFKIAGVRYLIMSLWEIDDSSPAVQEFFNGFYDFYLRQGQNVHLAFKNAQERMRQKWEDPYYWAGFILVE